MTEIVLNRKAFLDGLNAIDPAIPKRLWMVVWDCGGVWAPHGSIGPLFVFETAKAAKSHAVSCNYLNDENGKYKIIRVK